MSFRKEIKSTLNKSKLNNLLKWIKDKGGEILYPERLINSIYFDNTNLNMYHNLLKVSYQEKISLEDTTIKSH